MPVLPCDCADCTAAMIARDAEVGTPNSTGEPEVVVFEDIQIPIPPESATAIFSQMDLGNTLATDRSEDAWNAARQRLEASLQPLTQPVQVGGYARDIREPRIEGGGVIGTFDMDTARELVRVASAGNVLLEDSGDGVEMRPVTHLENEGWKLYFGTPAPLRLYGGDTVSFYDIKDRLGIYATFRRTERRKYIKQALKNARREFEAKRPDAEWTPKRAEDFGKFLDGVKSRLIVETNPFLSLPLLPHKTLSSRNWGIEIEAVDIGGVKTPLGWELKGDGSLRNLNHSALPSRSVPHEENCMLTTNPASYCSCAREQNISSELRPSEVGEWNSPVLRSYHSRGLKHLTDAIEMRPTNHSPGVHVHVEASDLSLTQATNLSIIYSALEPLFEAEYMRQERRFCAGVDTGEMINRFNKLRAAKAAGKGTTEVSYTSRYWTVNMASLSQHGTIEFRAMGARYNYEHLIRWAYLCREMVNLAKADVPQKAWSQVHTIKDLVVLFSKYGKETPTPEWAGDEPSSMTSVIEKLGIENRRKQHSAPLKEGSRVQRVFDDYTTREAFVRNDGRYATAGAVASDW